MNRNRFSAVATISVPTLGIKGKKITKKERYLETIDPAPATPAGEPLGEIEVEVSEEMVKRLKLGWSVEVAKNNTNNTNDTAPPLLLETSFPEELAEPRQDTHVSESPTLPNGPRVFSSVPPTQSGPHSLVKNVSATQSKNATTPKTLLLATTHPTPLPTRTSDTPIAPAQPKLLSEDSPEKPKRSGDIPVTETSNPEHSPAAQLESTSNLDKSPLNDNSPTDLTRNKITPTPLDEPTVVRESAAQTIAESLSATTPETEQAATSTALPEWSRDIPVPQISNPKPSPVSKLESTSNLDKHPITDSPVTDLTRDTNVPAPLDEPTPATSTELPEWSRDIPVPEISNPKPSQASKLEPRSNLDKHPITDRPVTDLTRDTNVPAPLDEPAAATSTELPEWSRDIPVPEISNPEPSPASKLEPTSNLDKHPITDRPVTDLARDTNVPAPLDEPTAATSTALPEWSGDIPVPEISNPKPSPVSKLESTSNLDKHPITDSPVTDLARDTNVPAPLDEHQTEAPPSLFRSRSFAALIDIAVASSFFVLGLLFFPDPPRVLPFVFAALYLLTKDSLGILNGQSIGKKLMKLRAVNRNHRSLAGNYKAGLMRNLSWLVAPIEFAILYVREDEVTIGKRLGDDWAATEVIVEKEPLPRKSKWLP